MEWSNCCSHFSVVCNLVRVGLISESEMDGGGQLLLPFLADFLFVKRVPVAVVVSPYY
jgi:hypothetical protein